MPVFKDIKTGEVKHVITCSYCESGKLHIIDPAIYPNDRYTEKAEKGYKCGNCIDFELQRKIVSYS